MHSFLSSRAQAFRHAFAGGWHVLRTQTNARIHAVISLGVIGLCLWLHLPAKDWAVIIVAMAMVWTAEFINTSLEAIIDLVSSQVHPLAKIGKDVSAAAVLIAAIASILIGLLILGPPLWEKLFK